MFPTDPTFGGHGLGRMVAQVSEGLRACGHDVTLFAKVGSRFSSTLVAPPEAEGYEGEKVLAREAIRMHRTDPFDVLLDQGHLHIVSRLYPNLPTINVYNDSYQPYQRNPVLMSSAQKLLMKPEFEQAPVIHNALNPAEFPFGALPQDPPFVFFCGIFSEIKQPFLAIEACAKLGVKLVMAGAGAYGKVPMAGSENVEYLGAISPQRRNLLMSRARVFLQLGTNESFGLTTLEAGLCGTPVVAWPAGGNLDTVENGVNGVFAPIYGRDKAGAVADAIETAWDMDRHTCRRYVEAKFSVERQLSAYEQLLVRAARGEVWR